MSNADFTQRMREAEEALRKRRGRPASPAPMRRINGGGGDLPAISVSSQKVTIGEVDVATIEMLAMLEKSMKDEFRDLIIKLPQVQMNKTLTINVGKAVKKLKGLRHRQLDTLIRVCSIRGRDGCRKNVLLKGPMGGGKSKAAEQVADILGVTFKYTGQAEMKSDVIGSVHPISGDYLSPAFVDIFINGGVWVGEEMDGWSPRACLAINVPLANGWIITPDGKRHDRHPDCVILACTNTWGTGATTEYVGRNKLDAAFLDRFSPRIDWQYDPDLERAIASNDYVVDAVQTARFNAEHSGLKVVISPRSSINIADMVECGFSLREAMDMDFLAGLDRSQVTRLLDGVNF